MKLLLDRLALRSEAKDKSCGQVEFEDLTPEAQRAVRIVGRARFEEYAVNGYLVYQAINPPDDLGRTLIETMPIPTDRSVLAPASLFGWPTGLTCLVEANLGFELSTGNISSDSKSRFTCVATDVFLKINNVERRLFVNVVGVPMVNHIWLADGRGVSV